MPKRPGMDQGQRVNPLQGGTAAILAGGLGTRLRSAVPSRPKVLADVAGRPFITYLLDRLEAAGIARVILCTGYLAEQVEERLGVRYGGMTLAYSRETTPLGTGGALGHAAHLFDSETVLVLNGDSYCTADCADFARRHAGKGAAASILLVDQSDTQAGGAVVIDGTNRVRAFREKEDQGPGYINAGVYLLAVGLLQTIQPGFPVSLEKDLFPQWTAQGLYAFPCAGRLLDIGTPETYARAEAFLGKFARGGTGGERSHGH